MSHITEGADMRALKFSRAWLCALGFMVMAASFQTEALTGRITWSSDGNYHDTDDWLAGPWALAMFRASDMVDQVVYYGYNSHAWDNSSTFASIHENNLKGTISRWGGFTESVLYNEWSNNTTAVNKLVEEINKSTSSNPLWLVAAGPIETIGKAVDAANSSALQHVTLLSHSTWNTDHAANSHNSKYSLSYIQNKGVNYKKIKDQNGDSNGGMTTQGLKRTTSVMDFLQTHSDSRMQWLWTCRKMPEYETPNYQKGYYDYSDAGMAYWLITGGNSGGDENATPRKTTDLLESFLTGTPPPAPTAHAVPGQVEAEDYSAQSGIQTESTSDAGGGSSVGFIQNGDYLEFLVDVAQSKRYGISYRVASDGAGGNIVLSSGGSTLATTSISPTGGWQTWSTVTENVALTSGEQTWRLTFTGGSGYLFNINYFTVGDTSDGTTPPPPTPTQGVFLEQNGIVAMEAESSSPNGDWDLATSQQLTDRYSGYKGTGVMLFNGRTEDGSGSGYGSMLSYKFYVSNPGNYRPYMRGMAWSSGAHDLANDVFIQMVGQSGAEGDVNKFFIRGYVQQAWHWMGTNHTDGDMELGHHNFYAPVYNLGVGEHEFRVYGRSKNFAFDRIVIAKAQYSNKNLNQLDPAESPVQGDQTEIAFDSRPIRTSSPSLVRSGVAIDIYDMAGRKIKTVGSLGAVDHLNLSAGIYTARQGSKVIPLMIR